MTIKDNLSSNKMTLLLYACAFLLLWEWLRPLKQLTDTAQLSVFIIFILMSFLLSFFHVHVLIRTGIKVAYIIYSLNSLYFEGSFFQFKWVPILIKDFFGNVTALYQGDWFALSDSFRSLLFFFLLALMTYLLHYWLINRKQIFIFFFMTILYITVLDTFTPYDAKYAIVRTVIIGFALMGMLTFFRILERENLPKNAKLIRKWLTTLVVMICVGVLFAYSFPKASPIWPDPVPYITSYSQNSGNDSSGGLNKVGYGVDDSKLGGPFLGDNTIVYETESDVRQYWKVESKDVYTGKGWISSVEHVRVSFDPGDTVPMTSFANQDMKTEERESIVKPLVNHTHIIYPAGLKSVDNEYGHHYELDIGLEKIYTMDTSGIPGIGEFTVMYDAPRYSIQSMKNTVDQSHSILSDEFLQQYTQLPGELPQRVKDLALEITEEEDNWYDKVKTIERYFHSQDYQYDQSDVAVPGENDDYVDQFLFETKRGYCDNFSTSMVVMLRSLGIPTRWAKGYTEGDFRGMGDSGKRLYVVTNNNAHSWVEVFFPEVGWVPFEPTKGFTNNAIFLNDHLSNENSESDTEITPEIPEMENQQKENEQTSNPTNASFSIKENIGKYFLFMKTHWQVLVMSSLIIAVVVVVLYKTRLKWLPRYLILRFKWRKKEVDFPVAYVVLLKHLSRYGLKRKPDQTLRDYAAYIDRYFSSEEMGILTANYERYVYKGDLKEGTWAKTRELWENLIKRTIA